MDLVGMMKECGRDNDDSGDQSDDSGGDADGSVDDGLD